MKTIRFYIALWGAKVGSKLLNLMGKDATTVPGRFAIKVCPDFLGRIGKPKTIIGITGTNGKTTVANITRDILKANKYDFIDNHLGGNINHGIASTFIKGATIFGKAKKDLAVLEIDERSSIRVFPYVTPTYLIITNISRDSLMRNAHTEFIAGMLDKYIPDETTIISNADDLIASYIKPNNKKVLYSIAELETDSKEHNTIVRDIRVCPKCHHNLEYDYIRFHHIGKAHCTNCDFKSLDAKYIVNQLDLEDEKMIVDFEDNQVEYKLLNNNIINVYNLLAATTVLKEFGLTAQQIKEAENLKVIKTRFDEREIGKYKIMTQLAKGINPIACSRAFEYVKTEKGNKAVIVILDDKYEDIKDTENISWIYDVDYELLNDDSIKQVIIAGPRRLDVYARLLIAGIDKDKIKSTKEEVFTASLVDLEAVDKIMIVHDMHLMSEKNKIMNALSKRIEESGENNEN